MAFIARSSAPDNIPVSGKPRSLTRKIRGFTLLEIMVVLVIIATIISFAALSIGPGKDLVKEEGQRLGALIDLASQEAILQGREIAIEFSDDGYAFSVFNGEEWAPFPEKEDILRERKLPDGILIDIELGEESMLPGDNTEEDKLTRIFLLSSGERTPFELTVRKFGEIDGYEISGQSRGRLKTSEHSDEI